VRRNYVTFFILSALVVGLDRLSKWYIDSTMSLHDTYPIIDGLFNITYVRNPGAAFGFLSNAAPLLRSGFLILVSTAAIAMILCYLARNRSAGTLLVTALSLIMGGAAGNLIDRVLFGNVIDFLDFYLSSYHWPAFNVADSAISIGAVLLIIELFRKRQAGVTSAGE